MEWSRLITLQHSFRGHRSVWFPLLLYVASPIEFDTPAICHAVLHVLCLGLFLFQDMF